MNEWDGESNNADEKQPNSLFVSSDKQRMARVWKINKKPALMITKMKRSGPKHLRMHSPAQTSATLRPLFHTYSAFCTPPPL
ncbi:hypothetical protein T02_7387 [Trichinella nativa]|uniref:Uncharacterized protein n=1 Tax=Trichinella nativa TaxID=6335 RepID=A0A0V1LSW4_9BILA|nr:hypothetical protein T06_9321 [Trichinella sp. T6]KRZ62290.1 hypothetical protein T02_7387 [Trichinella nativa]